MRGTGGGGKWEACGKWKVGWEWREWSEVVVENKEGGLNGCGKRAGKVKEPGGWRNGVRKMDK